MIPEMLKYQIDPYTSDEDRLGKIGSHLNRSLDINGTVIHMHAAHRCASKTALATMLEAKGIDHKKTWMYLGKRNASDPYSKFKNKWPPNLMELENEWPTFFTKPADVHVAVVRDPVERFKSCYAAITSTILRERILAVENKDLKMQKDLDAAAEEFSLDNVLKFEIKEPNEKIGTRRHHCLVYYIAWILNKQVDYLGTDPSEYARIFNANDMQAFADYMSEVAGKKVVLQNMNITPKTFLPTLTPEQEELVRQYYAEDYIYLEG